MSESSLKACKEQYTLLWFIIEFDEMFLYQIKIYTFLISKCNMHELDATFFCATLYIKMK